MFARIFIAAAILVTAWTPAVFAQAYPPGQFAIDGVPVVCGYLPTVLTTAIGDVAMNNGQAIFLNPFHMGWLPTALKLYIYAHECGHAVVGFNESAADCWAIRTGRDQGWFPPEALQQLQWYFANNPGDFHHPPGWARVQNMISCYQN